MSFTDDLFEALRSVKRDFFREQEYTDQDPRQQQGRASAAPQGGPVDDEPLVQAPPPHPEPPRARGAEPQRPPVVPPPEPDEEVMERFRQASSIADEVLDNMADERNERQPADTDPTPYRSYDPDSSGTPVTPDFYNDGDLPPRYAADFEDVYGDDKTVISRNTVIRGALQTEDSLRLLGQILGDIDCKSNIVVAGKVRGNTTAANAYIYDAQVDGDVRCDDAINISDDAWILGNIRAQQAEVEGKIKGNLEIRHSVSIGSTSSILGDISTDELEIKRGAFINGQIMMYSPSRDVLDRFDSFED